MSLVTEVLLVSGVALDLVGAGVLAHAHNAESIVELRDEIGEEIGEEGAALGEPDALATHAKLLAEKRVGFLLFAVGLSLYLCALVLKSSESTALMGGVAVAALVIGLGASAAFVRIAGDRLHRQARRADTQDDPSALPEQ